MEIGNLYSSFIRNTGLYSTEMGRNTASKSGQEMNAAAGTKSAAAQRAQIEEWRETRRESREVRRLSSADTSGNQNRFERTLNTYSGKGQSLIGELADQAGSEMGVKADSFEQYLNKMAYAYGEMKDAVEEMYSVPDSEKEYYLSYDSDGKKLRFPKQISSEAGETYRAWTYPGFLSAVNRGSGSFFGRMLGNLSNWLGL